MRTGAYRYTVLFTIYTRALVFPRHPIASRRESHVHAPDKIVIDGTGDRYFALASLLGRLSLCAGKIGRSNEILRNYLASDRFIWQ